MVAKKPPQDFPPYTCGTCNYCHFSPDDTKRKDLLCWANPSTYLFVTDDDMPIFHRGVPAAVDSPACRYFKPREHS